MSITVNIDDPRSCRLAKLLKAIAEYLGESGNGRASLDMDLRWKEQKVKENAD